MRRVLLVAAFVAVGLVVSLHARPLDQGEGEENFHKPWHKPAVNQKPLIGILAQACHHCPGRCVAEKGGVACRVLGWPAPLLCISCRRLIRPRCLLPQLCRSYVAAGFVKWIEAAGGRPVPVKCVGGFAG